MFTDSLFKGYFISFCQDLTRCPLTHIRTRVAIAAKNPYIPHKNGLFEYFWHKKYSTLVSYEL